jgi:hypothetical protein
MGSEPPKAIPDPLAQSVCALYKPGHQPHFIQAKLAWEDDPAKHRNGTLISVEDDGWITVEADREILRFWNHEPARARACFKQAGGRVGIPGHSLLHAPHKEGRKFCFSVSDDGPTPCAPPPTPDSSPAGLHAQVLSHGGFLVSCIEAVRHQHDDDVTDTDDKGMNTCLEGTKDAFCKLAAHSPDGADTSVTFDRISIYPT